MILVGLMRPPKQPNDPARLGAFSIEIWLIFHPVFCPPDRRDPACFCATYNLNEIRHQISKLQVMPMLSTFTVNAIRIIYIMENNMWLNTILHMFHNDTNEPAENTKSCCKTSLSMGTKRIEKCLDR